MKIRVLFILFFALFVAESKADNLKVGIVDVITVIKALPEADQGDKFLKELGTKFQDTLLQMQKDLEAKLENYKKQKGMMQAAEQQKTEESLQAQNQKILVYQNEKFGNQGELAQRRESIMDPIREKVNKAIQEVAKEEKISFVLEKGTGVIYSDEKLDLTYKIIDNIKRGATSTTDPAKPIKR